MARSRQLSRFHQRAAVITLVSLVGLFFAALTLRAQQSSAANQLFVDALWAGTSDGILKIAEAERQMILENLGVVIPEGVGGTRHCRCYGSYAWSSFLHTIPPLRLTPCGVSFYLRPLLGRHLTAPITCRRPPVSSHVLSEPQLGGSQVQWLG
jgi:hypothetical protein